MKAVSSSHSGPSPQTATDAAAKAPLGDHYRQALRSSTTTGGRKTLPRLAAVGDIRESTNKETGKGGTGSAARALGVEGRVPTRRNSVPSLGAAAARTGEKEESAAVDGDGNGPVVVVRPAPSNSVVVCTHAVLSTKPVAWPAAALKAKAASLHHEQTRAALEAAAQLAEVCAETPDIH